MDDLANLIQRVRSGETEAFKPVVKRFEDMAVGYAYSILGDFHLAEDAAQNAFLTAFLNLESVKNLVAFPGWMRRIVFTECTRLTREKQPGIVDLDRIVDTGSDVDPNDVLVASERGELVKGLIGELPDGSREVVILYYLADLSLKETANFLGTQEGTVKKRLHDARVRMRKEVERMAKDHLQGKKPSRDNRFSESVVALITTAVEAIGNGESDRLRSFLEAHPDIVNVGGALDFRKGGDGYFSGASLLHFAAGCPSPHNPMPANVLDIVGILLDAGADPNATTADGHTMLGLIASHSLPRERGVQVELIDLLVGRGADPSAGLGRSALENALWHGETDAALALFRHGTEHDFRLAAGLGRVDLMEGFLKEDESLKEEAYSLVPPRSDGSKPTLSDGEVLVDALALAVLNRQFGVVDYLLGKKADINGYTRCVHAEGHTALHFACSVIPRNTARNDSEMVAFLLDRGADPMKKDEVGPNVIPINWAVHNGNAEIVEYMLDRGACDPSETARHKHLCHVASGKTNVQRKEDLDVARVLLTKGADPSYPCGPGNRTATEVARDAGQEELLAILMQDSGG